MLRGVKVLFIIYKIFRTVNVTKLIEQFDKALINVI